MNRILFCNTKEPQCGVHQFGVNLFSNLHSQEFSYFYDQPTSIDDVRNYVEKENIQAVIVNWHPDIGGWPNEIEKLTGVKKVLSYHDWEVQEDKWDAIVFADPTMVDHGKWFSIPRPIPKAPVFDYVGHSYNEPLKVGLHGFYGASAHLVVERLISEFPDSDVEIRVHAPVATYGDASGRLIFDVFEKVSDITDNFPKYHVIPDFRFLPQDKMIWKLSQNDINVYIRDTSAEWRGISSALDVAVAAGRPLAINGCKGFRHLHGLKPSIQIEDNSIHDILGNGTAPLKDYIAANSPEKLTEKMDDVMRRIL